jgi:hypothetical protein
MAPFEKISCAGPYGIFGLIGATVALFVGA